MHGRTDDAWPELPVAEWAPTRDTLQLWTQIVGKIRLAHSPLLNHWWNVPLYVTARGLTTSLMWTDRRPPASRSTSTSSAHQLIVDRADGARRTVPLTARPVAEFYADLMRELDELGIDADIWPVPVEIPDAVPFADDRTHATYDPDQVARFWRLLTTTSRVLAEFRTTFVGKSSPVHLFWGALDLATTRFSGRTAPAHPAGAPNCGPHVMLEAYSQEVSSAGYWPGGADEGVFYSYAYPEHARLSRRTGHAGRRATTPSSASSSSPTTWSAPPTTRARCCWASSTARTPQRPTPAAGTAPHSSAPRRRGPTTASPAPADVSTERGTHRDRRGPRPAVPRGPMMRSTADSRHPTVRCWPSALRRPDGTRRPSTA